MTQIPLVKKPRICYHASMSSPFPYAPLPEPEDPMERDLPGVPPVVRARVTEMLGEAVREVYIRRITNPKDVNGRKLVEKVHYAFEAIGGEQALAVWASNNPTKFYTTLLARMLPQGSSPVMQDNSEVVFRLAVPVKTIDVIEGESSRSGPGTGEGSTGEPPDG